MNKKIINSVEIDRRDLPSIKTNRNLKVVGDVGAEFTVNVIKINNNSKESYYDFISESFTNDFSSKNNLKKKLNSKFSLSNIVFPADSSGDVYKILVIAHENKNTQFKNGGNVFSVNITQVGQTSFYIELDEGSEVVSGIASYYTSNPPDTVVQSTGSTASVGFSNIPVSFTLTNANHNSYGSGFKLPNLANTFSIPDSYFYSAVIKNAVSSVSNSTTVVLDSVENIAVGMGIGYYNSGSISGVPLITAINGNTITLSVAQSIGAGNIQFRAYGPSLMRSSFGFSPEFLNFIAQGENLTTTVRTSTTLPASNTQVSIPVNGTRGISIGSRFTGFNVNKDSNNNLIGGVSASETAGTITISSFQGASNSILSSVITAGTQLTIIGSHKVVTITGTVRVNKYPSSNIKIALDLNKFITHGTFS